MQFWLYGMIQSTCQPESTLFPVSVLVVATSLTASNLRPTEDGPDPTKPGRCVTIGRLSTDLAEGAR